MNENTENHPGLAALTYLMYKNPLPGFIVDRNQNHRIIEVNQKALLLYRFPKQEFLGKHLHEISLSNQSITAINDFYQNNILIPTIKTKHITKTKQILNVEIFITLLDNYTFFQIKPDDEFENNKEQIRDLNQRYSDLFNSMVTGYARHKIILDKNGQSVDYRFLEINPALEKIIGKSAKQVVGKTALQIWPGLDTQLIKTFGEVALEGKPTDFKFYDKVLNKHLHIYASSSVPGEFTTIVLDISQHKFQEARLLEHQNLLKDINQHIDEIFWVRDKQSFNYLYVTPNYEIFYNEPVESLYQNPNAFFKWVHPEDLPKVKAHIEALLTTNQGYDIEYRILQKGKIRWVRARAYPLYNENLIITRFGGVVQDITDQKLTHEKLQQYTHEREQDLSILYQVSYIANHQNGLVNEIQNLLAIIAKTTKAFASLLVFSEKHPLIEKPILGFPHRFLEIINPNINTPSITLPSCNQGKQKIITGNELPDIPLLPDDQILVTPLSLSGVIYGHLLFIFHPNMEITTGNTTLILAVADQLAMVLENLNLRNLIKKNAVVEERQRISRELHDSVTQSLYSLNLISQAGLDRLEENELEETRECLIEIQANAIQSLKEMRLLLYELHPPILEEIGLIGAVQNRLNSVERKTNINVKFEYQDEAQLPTALQAELYRIVIEALNNIIKHARADQIELGILITADRVTLKIIDNGVGFDLKTAEKLGFGLTAMKQRAQKIFAKMDIQSQTDLGTAIHVECPIKKDSM